MQRQGTKPTNPKIWIRLVFLPLYFGNDRKFIFWKHEKGVLRGPHTHWQHRRWQYLRVKFDMKNSPWFLYMPVWCYIEISTGKNFDYLHLWSTLWGKTFSSFRQTLLSVQEYCRDFLLKNEMRYISWNIAFEGKEGAWTDTKYIFFHLKIRLSMPFIWNLMSSKAIWVIQLHSFVSQAVTKATYTNIRQIHMMVWIMMDGMDGTYAGMRLIKSRGLKLTTILPLTKLKHDFSTETQFT